MKPETKKGIKHGIVFALIIIVAVTFIIILLQRNINLKEKMSCEITMKYDNYDLRLFGVVTKIVDEESLINPVKECCCININGQGICICDKYQNITEVGE